MRRALIALGAALACAWPATAGAAPVLRLGHDGRVRVVEDRFLAPVDLPAQAPRIVHSTLTRRAVRRRRPQTAVLVIEAALRGLARRGAISGVSEAGDLATVDAAQRALGRLRGARALELGGVLRTVAGLAAAGRVNAMRLPALMQTVERNRQWWMTGSLLAPAARVEFAGSELVWQYYPGQGLQIQPLASFGKADGLSTAGPASYPRLRELLGELIALAVRRSGATTWEYYFTFDGGRPPWTSAMTQGTAIEALTRAYEAFGERSYLELARSALGLFEQAPPSGVRVRTARGARYAQYSFAPGTSILNAFVQSLIGLYDYAHVSGDTTAARLFAAGDAEARSELPSFDTGAWSLYEPGMEDSLDYHVLVTGFLAELCSRTRAPGYCQEAARFQSYLHIPPALSLDTTRVRAGVEGVIRFSLSKVSRVGIVVTCAGRRVLYTSAPFAHGTNGFAVPALAHPGACSVRLAATDLAGNVARLQGGLTVWQPRRRVPKHR